MQILLLTFYSRIHKVAGFQTKVTLKVLMLVNKLILLPNVHVHVLIKSH